MGLVQYLMICDYWFIFSEDFKNVLTEGPSIWWRNQGPPYIPQVGSLPPSSVSPKIAVCMCVTFLITMFEDVQQIFCMWFHTKRFKSGKVESQNSEPFNIEKCTQNIIFVSVDTGHSTFFLSLFLFLINFFFLLNLEKINICFRMGYTINQTRLCGPAQLVVWNGTEAGIKTNDFHSLTNPWIQTNAFLYLTNPSINTNSFLSLTDPFNPD